MINVYVKAPTKMHMSKHLPDHICQSAYESPRTNHLKIIAYVKASKSDHLC